MPLIPLQEAQKKILSACTPMEPRALPLKGALGLVCKEDIDSPENVPPFDNTAMDGFALRSEDTGAGKEFEIIGTLSAGSSEVFEVKSGQAVRIMTGAPIPKGADAILKVEDANVLEDGSGNAPGGASKDASAVLEIPGPVKAGTHIRRAGDDLKPGQKVLRSGQILGPAQMGVLASIGVENLMAYPRARVGVMSTGDELVEGAKPLAPGQIRDSNRLMLISLLKKEGIGAFDMGCIRDNEKAIKKALQKGASKYDAILSSGGVSMGDFDYVKKVLGEIGDMDWMQIAIKPAKPLAFGHIGPTPVFGLPGNPVSSMVSFELFALPALRKMMGHIHLHRPLLRAEAEENLLREPDGKTHFLRVIWQYKDGKYTIRSAGAQGSHQLQVLADANGLAVLPDGKGVKAGGETGFFKL